MKKFSKVIAWILTAVIFMTCADYTPLVVLAAEEATDAYKAYDNLLSKTFEAVRDQVYNMENMISSSPYQNLEQGRYTYLFGNVNAPAVTYGEGAWPILNASQTIGDSAYHSPVQYFNQIGIQATAQMKAGNWLDDTKYDATAGAPTTENFFITIGGTQYIVDIEYEFISRPYVRRYFFSAGAANYRYYKLGSFITNGQINKDYYIDVVTDWSHNLRTPNHNALRVSDGIGGWKDLSRYNAAYLKLAQHLEVRVTSDGNDSYLVFDGFNRTNDDLYDVAQANGWNPGMQLDYHWNQSSRYNDMYENYSYDYIWWAARVDNSVDSIDMHPGLAQAIATKQQIWSMVMSIKNQYRGQDDNYRADQGAYNVDKPDDYAPEVWDPSMANYDYVNWMYTYYGMVRRGKRADGTSAAGGNGTTEYDNVKAESNSYTDYSTSHINMYDSTNVFCPTIVTYLHDYYDYGYQGLDDPNIVKNMDSTPILWASLQSLLARFGATGGDLYAWLSYNSGYDPQRDTSKAPIKTTYPLLWKMLVSGACGPEESMSGHYLSHLGTFGNTNITLFTTDWGNSYQNEIVDSSDLNTSAVHSMPSNQEITTGAAWLGHIPYRDIYDTKAYRLSTHTQISYSPLTTHWYCYLNDIMNLRSTGVMDVAFSHAPNITQDMLAFTSYTNFDTRLSVYNQLADVYMSQVYNLFLSVSGLFYADEVVELFGTDIDGNVGTAYAVQGFDPQLVLDNPDTYNACVAHNLYTMFGEPVTKDEDAIRDFSFSFSWVWACFPLGGDLDGPMEDAPDTDYSDVLGQGATMFSTSNYYPDLTESSFFFPMNISPQFVKFSRYLVNSNMTQTIDSHDTDGHYYQWAWHGDDSTPAPTPTCAHTTYPGWGPHGCSYIAGHGWGTMVHCTTCTAMGGHGHSGCTYGDSDCDCNGTTKTCTDCNYDTTTGDWIDCGDCSTCGTKDCNCPDSFVACSHSGTPHTTITNNATNDNRTDEYHFHSFCDNNGTTKSLTSNGGDHGVRSYRESVNINTTTFFATLNNNAEADEGRTWTEETKYMTYGDIINQTFDSVQYLNIISYSIWALDKAEVRGLSSLLGNNTLTNAMVNTTDGVITTSENSILNLLGYDIDESTIDNDPGYVTTTHGGKTYWNNLEVKGRVANSFNIKSVGNIHRETGNTDKWVLVPTTDEAGRVNFGTISSAFSTRIADNPRLSYDYVDGDTNLVNDDPYAFHCINYKPGGNTDDLYFTFNPYKQGGRSHSSFGGFVMQGIARTLFTLDPDHDWTSGVTLADLNSEENYAAYSNSLRIQGDYLAIETQPGVYLTLVGSIYDTWDERYVNEPGPNSYSDLYSPASKFKLVLDLEDVDSTIYTASYAGYYSPAPWVPGRLSYILSRENWHDSTSSLVSLKAPDHVTIDAGDCWVIHTYCHDLNDHTYGKWDQVYFSRDGNPQLADSIQFISGCINLQGCINPWLRKHDVDPTEATYGMHYPGGSTWDDVLDESGYFSKYAVFYNKLNGSDHFQSLALPMLACSQRSNYRYRSLSLMLRIGDTLGYTDKLDWYSQEFTMGALYGGMFIDVPLTYDTTLLDNANTIFPDDMSITEKATVAAIPRVKMGRDLTNWRGKNNVLLMSDTNGKQLPYVGYQSAGDGTTSIIHTKNSDITQTGYSNPFGNPAFDATKTFVSDVYGAGTSVFRGTSSFSAFGLWTHHNYKSVYQNAISDMQNAYTHTGNEAPDNTVDEGKKFGVYYPWISDINLNRYLPNGLYYSGQIYNVYKQLVNSRDNYSTVLSQTLNRSSELRVNADYTRTHNPRGNVSVYNLPNAITIYNPVTVESAHYVSPSEYMPDGSNYGGYQTTDASGNPIIVRGGYLQSFMRYVTRDQRVAKISAGGSVTGQEEYTIGGSTLLVGQTTSSSSFHYELRVSIDAFGEFTESAIDTKYYTMVDYDIRTEILDPEIIGGTTGKTVQEIRESSTYKISVSNTAGNWYSAIVNLDQGDVISWEDNAIVLSSGSDTFNLPYSSWQEAYKAYEEAQENFSGTYTNTNNFVTITAGMDINPLDATFDMPKGSMLEYTLFLERTDGGNLSTNLPFDLDLPADRFKTHIVHDPATNMHTVYIEALVDTQLQGLSCKATQNFRLLSYSGSALKSSKVLLMKVGNSDTYVQGITSISYFFEQENWSINSVEAWGAYNDSYVDISGSWELSGYTATYERNTVYIQNVGGTVVVTLDQSDPHKVPNTNWRYYVLGWKTIDGNYILNINDPALAEGAVVELIPPIGKLDAYTITAAYLDTLSDQGKLAVAFLDGVGYLMLTEWFVNGATNEIRHTLEWYGITCEVFDIVSFGEETTTLYNTLISWDLTSYDHRHEIWQYSYECVFRATGHAIFRCAYDVKYSMNLLHKVSLGSTDYLLDWVQVPDLVPEITIQQREQITGTYMSLDDEYIIYWDNLANLSTTGNPSNESVEISSQLWRGWDAWHGDDSFNMHGLPGTGSIKNSALTGLTADWWSTLTANPVADLTDTTKWIYSKYLTFNVDMYGFTEGASFTLNATYDPKNVSQNFNPTTPAFRADGTPNNVVYIPAGTPVHLGYYQGDSTDDNSGEFIDYGFEYGTTKDPNDYKYTYHFWVPLEVGESNENVVVEYHVTSINNGDDDNPGNINDDLRTDANQASWNIAGVTRVARTIEDFFRMYTGTSDEWDQFIVRLGSTQNLNNVQRINQIVIENANSPTTYVRNIPRAQDYIRPTNAYTTSTLSIVGRMGNLTVVDTGDPRYQDSFKEGSATEFAISPIVKAVTRYTNTSSGEGHQIQFLTDIQDVRGRLVLMDPASNGLENHPNYLYVPKNLSNTYSSQVFREWARNFKLPMTPEFSIHEDMNLPMQKLGYEIYCSLETIGNYYGSSEQRPSGGEPSNYSDDYGQTKVQVRPVYIFIPADGSDPYALDVYYRRNGSYQLLNAGTPYASLSEAQADGSSDQGPFYLQAAYDAQYSMSIETNTAVDYDQSTYYKLDQTLMRRMVTEQESRITYNVVKNAWRHSNVAVSSGITKTLLEPISLATVSDPEALLDFKYYYGNPQIEFLREYNRTFIGGVNKQIQDGAIASWTNNAQKYAQKWYFGLGLPSTSIFIKHGTKEFTDENIVNYKDGWILVTIDTYAIGEKWVLHYESHSSDEGIKINGNTYTRDRWNVYPNKLPHLVPVSIYDTTSMSSGDLDTRGTF